MNIRACCLGLLSPLLICSAPGGYAGSATWSANPPSADWNTATNWMPNTVPNGGSDVATFATSNQTGVAFSQVTEINSIVFDPGASAFTITNAPFHLVTISGAGVINNSGRTQRIVSDMVSDMESGTPRHQSDFPAFPSVTFTNNATAGSNVVYTSKGGIGEVGVGGNFNFTGSSSADHATFDIFGSRGRAYASEVSFSGSSTAANATINLIKGGQLEMETNSPDVTTLGNAIVSNNGGFMFISGVATAGEATIINTSTLSQLFTSLTFSESVAGHSTAGSANITNQGATATAKQGTTLFQGTATAGQAVITNNGGNGAGTLGGSVAFSFTNASGTPTADAATLIANPGTNGGNGGLITFVQDSLGGTARCELFGNGSLDLSAHLAPGVTTGSIEGDGLIFLGARNLALGSSNSSTTFSGVIQDGGSAGGTGGSLTKIGTGSLTLSGANTYTGGTTVAAGTLAVANLTASGTGTGAVQVNGGTLGGSGIIGGTTTIGTGSGPGAFLAPATGTRTPANLTILSALTFKADAIYTYTFKARSGRALTDEVVANGVTIESGATFRPRARVQGDLRQGLTLTVLSNTAATAIAGTFANLPDGAILTVGSNHLQASYEGGDGNDLTLTVVP
jgi:autotransporter-associated beta strand protein